ncbi:MULTISPECIES: hypothetical protein [unclassified Rhizobacter]|uniref:hypothetical protein n=1 Tax=unclassified Rhizobacter TaxID=2640088 RepID=UPI0006F5C124|nr:MULTISPECIES: hypothetical protein [unclassified Rhizobacter]KQU75565.1 hypothetical protein ASC88_24680 [Rhizobacter sp. Root29]KQW06855.1 hypothetical protein ASC98_25780 [Rhizobacter sp. Root1238]KRB19023.1 hypothetical protein ASE08_07415 [Rhizobacter sp. Root16D2]
MRHLKRTPLLSCGLATVFAALALEATAQVPAHMPDPEKADEQAKRLAMSPFRRILEAGRVEVKLRRETEAPAPAVPAPRRVTAAAPPAPKPHLSRAAPAEAPASAPAPAPLLALAPASTAPAVSPLPVTVAAGERLWTAFNATTAAVEGGTIEGLVYAEKPGDAALGDITVRNSGVLNVTGQFTARGGSQWAGVGIVLVAPGTVVATEYKALRIHLAGHTVSKLRLRLVGDNPAVQQRGCYPILMLPVKPQVTEYRIEFSQFAAPEYCGADGVDVKSTLGALTAIEIADAPEPVADRTVSFNVGTLSLLK